MTAPSAPTPDEAQQPEPAAPAPSTAVTRHEPLDARIRYAHTIAAAGTLLPRGLRDGINPRDADALAGRVFLIAETGNMLGIHPVAALQGVNIIEGTPAISPALMTALVRRAGHKVRTRVEGTVAEGTIKAVCQVIRHDDPEWPFTSTWDLERAERAGLATVKRDERTGRTAVHARSKSGKVLPWEAYTEAMLKARAIGEACREAAEDALMGVHYVPEEIGGHVNESGELVGEVIEEPAPRRSGPVPPAESAADDGEAVGDSRMLTEHLYGLAREAMSAEDLTEAWSEGAELFKRSGMAGTFGAWAAGVTVDVKDRTVTLRDLFAELGQAARQASQTPAQGKPTPPAEGDGPPEGGNGPQAGAYATATPDDEPVDAEVVEDEPTTTSYGVPGRGGYTQREGVDPNDPWASDPPEPGVEAVAAVLGGEVDSVEGEGVTDAEVRHEQAKARAAKERKRETPADRQTPPRTSGREAFAAAKEELRRKAEAAERE